ncbi:Galactan endo-beta-1,3-galactanase [Ceratocystis lukuohia]|uniref:Galactan endo-beta-1,3-galactanase n=1 Tax=Ceratocystis lukuohia TaxID=2019550 RepID=A0ABR4MK85_9PEZI
MVRSSFIFACIASFSASVLAAPQGLATPTTASLVSRTTPDPNVLIPSTAFSSESLMYQYFNWSYPWGTDHNGSARMARSQVVLSEDTETLTLNASRVDGQPPASSGGKKIDVHYLSGAVYAYQHFTVNPGGGITYSGEFKAPVAKGTWPAFWLTASSGWPPEIDMAEWKGSGKISFNTFNTSSEVQALDVEYPTPEEWHKIRCETYDKNGEDVGVRFFMDDKLITTQTGKGFVGKGMRLIINLQMEGSSGSPGPETDTLYEIRGITAYKTTNKVAST